MSPPHGKIDGKTCWICLLGEDDDDDDDVSPKSGEIEPLVRNCACRGPSAGFAHVSCIADYARRSFVGTASAGSTKSPHSTVVDPWVTCHNCKQEMQGDVALSLATIRVNDAKSTPEDSEENVQALSNLGDTHCYSLEDPWSAIPIYGQLLKVLERSYAKKRANVTTQKKRKEFHAVTLTMAQVLRNLAISIARAHKDYKASLAFFEEARMKCLEVLPPNSMLVQSIAQEAESIRAHVSGDVTASLDLAKSRVDGKGPYSAPSAPHSSAESLKSKLHLAALYRDSGNLAEAAKVAGETLTTAKRTFGPDHHDTRAAENAVKSIEEMQRSGRVFQKQSAGTPSNVGRLTGLKKKADLNGATVAVLRSTKDGGKLRVRLDNQGSGNHQKQPAEYNVPVANVVLAPLTTVKFRGLVSAREWNGKEGEIQTFDEEKGRYLVKTVRATGTQMWVKPANCFVG